jgi:coenzyme F420-reducing hydrogenase beta subunit
VIAALVGVFEKYEKIAVIGIPCQVHSAWLKRDKVNEKC